MCTVEERLEKTEEYSLSAHRYPHLRNCIDNFVCKGDVEFLDIEIDTNHHVYLKDHIFGTDSFVPATMIMELLFEAAMFYSEFQLKLDIEGLKPARLIDFNILRALAMPPGESMKIRYLFKEAVRKASDIEFDIEIVSKRVNKSNVVLGTRLNTSSKVVLSYETNDSPRLSMGEQDFIYYQVPKDIYYEYFFPSLGPLFQSSCTRFAISKDKTCFIGEYDCFNKEQDFILEQQSAFLTSPLGNDSCLQYAVFLSRIINLIGRLPIGGKRLEFYKKHPVSGSVKVFVECISIGDDMVCNIYSFDATGIIFRADEFVVKKSPYHALVDREKFDDLLSKYETEPHKW